MAVPTGNQAPPFQYSSLFVSVLYLVMPFTGDAGSCPIVPTGMLMASVLALRSRDEFGDIVPMPTLPAVTIEAIEPPPLPAYISPAVVIERPVPDTSLTASAEAVESASALPSILP